MKLKIRRTVTGASAFAALLVAAAPLSSPATARAQLISTRGDERRADMEQRQRALRSLSRLLNKPPRTEKVRRPS